MTTTTTERHNQAETLAAGQEPAEFILTSGRWVFSATGGETLAPIFGNDPVGTAAALLDQLKRMDAATGRTHVVCGLIPFDLAEASSLRITSEVGFAPRSSDVFISDEPPCSSENAADSLSVVSDAAQPGPHAPDDPEYRANVRRILDAIEDGTVEKVVLSRRAEFDLNADGSLHETSRQICNRLAAASHSADIFACHSDDGAIWLGASPEVIADVRSGRFLTHPLAGSLPRTITREQAETRLRGSDKDLREHAFVVSHIHNALEPFTHDLTVPEAPSVFQTDSMWHLGTRILGELRPGVSSLETALAIHPTPAVCGVPTEDAARLIGETEEETREFYSGLVGWMDASGDGRWSLVLRGAKLKDGTIRLQAGAGIVDGSDPELEHAETGAKFGTMLSSLGGLVAP